ncbi:HlyC/CorC family transporter [Pleionea sp. CnH1-48]|uniref:HlyC/CorC family transporter n=1 Tax=Pleionea sp. CnH1-48 TaxID=2954494 RepID=UPI0020974FFB|nr:transporter associated domain-containing protein [Pleionea sp. CnH1-48]MCO7225027.1 CBS domain-containing protein [Pleionea sp. CnH1-48]
MNDEKPPSRTWLERLGLLFQAEPKDRADILEILKTAEQNSLINSEVLTMLEGVLQVSEMQVRDIMLPRSQMVVIEQQMPLLDILKTVIESAHSRFPVIGDNRDDVEGVLLAKDLLPVLLEKVESKDFQSRFDLKDILRPSVIVPESKRLDVLLKEFRVNRNHMAIVVDEYGGVAGLVTIEDVLEQIVGEIEDEFDIDDEDDLIKKHSETEFMLKAQTPIDEFNEYFNAQLSDEEFDTIGGLIMQALGHMPARGEVVELEHYKFTVTAADTRRVKLLKLNLLNRTPELEQVANQ